CGYFRLPPASWLIDLRNAIKADMGESHVAPPVSDADQMTIVELSRALNISAQTLLDRMSAAGVAADSFTTLAGIASKTGLAPEALYRKLTRQLPPP
ncbi:MAG: hypothetical protein JXA71_01955, partial [Chitinispirillaceae bacterium]|nr:hypothetical protein [Chitinispirillaceae bacterium]